MPRPRPLGAPSQPPPRYSRRALPPYRHVPGLTPHPLQHPRGHSHGQAEPAPSKACSDLPRLWRVCPEYLFGADLFNRAYLWEAHEAWEIIWKGAGPDTLPGRFAQGLIQAAACLLRRHLGTAEGSIRLWAKACRRFDQVESNLAKDAGGSYMGLEIVPWRARVVEYLGDGGALYPFLCLGSQRPPAE